MNDIFNKINSILETTEFSDRLKLHHSKEINILINFPMKQVKDYIITRQITLNTIDTDPEEGYNDNWKLNFQTRLHIDSGTLSNRVVWSNKGVFHTDIDTNMKLWESKVIAILAETFGFNDLSLESRTYPF